VEKVGKQFGAQMRLSAMESGDSYQIRAERILITTLCPFWGQNRPTSEFNSGTHMAHFGEPRPCFLS